MPKPKALKKGDTIGIICPAFSISLNSPRIPVLEHYLRGMGFNIRYGKTFGASYGYLSGYDRLRTEDIEEMFSDGAIHAVICMLGGYGTSRIVDRIDYDIIAANPKLFIGFSDITVLLNTFYKFAMMPTIHGALGVYLGNPDFDEYSKRDFENLLFLNQKGRILKNPDNDAVTIKGGKIEGKLIGGNLSLIAALLGTPYEIDFTDKIVFIEDVDEKPYRIDRYLCSLRLSGQLERAKGFVFGVFKNCNAEGRSWSCQDVIKQYVDIYEKPAIYNFSSGHSFPFINIPIGLAVKLDADEKTLTISEELYSL